MARAIIGAPPLVAGVLLAVALATVTVFPSDRSTQAESSCGEGGVSFGLNTPATPVPRGSIFLVEIEVGASSTCSINAAQAHLRFDPQYLQAVDQEGNPATTITPGPIFDEAWQNPSLENKVDNATGQIKFAGGRGAGGLDAQSPFVLATVRFKAVLETPPEGATNLTFLREPTRRTKAVQGFSDVTGITNDQTLEIVLTVQAIADAYEVEQGAALQVDVAHGVLANDIDPEAGALTAALETGATNGDLTLHPDGSFEYIPNPAFVGADAFTYQAVNSEGLRSSPVTASITVQAVQHIVQGQALLEGRPEHAGITITFSGQEPLLTDAAGRFTAQLPPGVYTISAEHGGFLPALKEDVVVDGDMTLPTVQLWNGDLNGDGAIDITDLTTLARRLNERASPWP